LTTVIYITQTSHPRIGPPFGRKRPDILEEITLKTKEYLDRTSIAIDRELERYENSRFFGPLKYALEGGKRIRPLLALLSAEAVGSKDDTVMTPRSQ